MDSELVCGLKKCETDLDGALRRFSGNETVYLSCLRTFLKDDTVQTLEKTLNDGAWDDAFTAAHALKGLAGNMGFIPLSHAASEMVMQIRSGRVAEANASFLEVKRCYTDVIEVLKKTIK